MRQFAQKVAGILDDLGDLETLAVKVASEKGSHEAQVTQAKCASILYDVIMKQAEALPETEPHQKVVALVEKMAAVLGRPALTPELKAKIASAVIVDSTIIKQEATTKTASLAAYGREYMAELLRGALTKSAQGPFPTGANTAFTELGSAKMPPPARVGRSRAALLNRGSTPTPAAATPAPTPAAAQPQKQRPLANIQGMSDAQLQKGMTGGTGLLNRRMRAQLNQRANQKTLSGVK